MHTNQNDYGLKIYSGVLSVYYFESESAAGTAYKKRLREVLQLAGFDSKIKLVISNTKAAKAKKPFAGKYYDMVISDMSLGNIEDRLGLFFLAQVKRDHPDIFTALITGHSLHSADMVRASQHVDIVINKTRLGNPEYAEGIADSFRKKLIVNVSAFVGDGVGELVEKKDKGALMDVNRAVRRLTYSGPPEKDLPRVGRVSLHPLESGHSGATVFQMSAKSDRGVPCLDAILKVALRTNEIATASIRREIDNYARYVRWNLPQQWRPELLGHSGGMYATAVCYASVASPGQLLQTVQDHARQGDESVITSIVDNLFSPDSNWWYRPQNIERLSSVQVYYQSRVDDDDSLEKQRTVFRRALSDYDTSDLGKIVIEEFEVTSPEVALYARPTKPGCTSIVHGDLNTANVFVHSRNSEVDIELIDFSESGRGHVFFDFVVFEVNLRLDSPGLKDCLVLEILRSEMAFLGGEYSAITFGEQIATLRTNAFQNFPDEPREHYFFALAAFAFDLIDSPNLGDNDRARLCSLICSSILKHESNWQLAQDV